jgi:hypothetical protein
MAARWITHLERIINKHNAVADEAIFTNRDQLTYKAMRLDARPVAYFGIVLNFDKRSNEATITNRTAIHINRFDYRHIAPKRNIHNSNFINRWLA